MDYSNLVDMFYSAAKKYPQKPVYGSKKEGQYHYISYEEAARKIASLGKNLAAHGVKKGDNIVLLSANRVEWAISDFAIMSTGAATVPIYPTLPANQIEYLVNDCAAKLIILSDSEQLQKIDEIRDNLLFLKEIIIMDKGSQVDDDQIIEFNKLTDDPDIDAESYFSNANEMLDPDDRATIIYTSGTTGVPKGVMLSHNNFIANITGTLKNIPIYESDLFLSVLPTSHVFERMAGHFLPIGVGSTIAYAEGFDTIVENLKEVKPSILMCVPRFYEKVYAKVLEGVEAGPALKQKIFNWALSIGAQVAELKEKRQKVQGSLARKYNLAIKLVFHKFYDAMGGRIRFFVSGGAPLSKEVAGFYIGAGFTLVEGYGLTETSPVIAVNKLDHFKIGSVGPLVPNVECKIADDGEILVKGPQVTSGYFKNKAATAEVFDDEGWFYTGDIGYLDDEQFLFITDRKKNLLVTAGGKNIAPQPIEMRLSKSPLIAYALLIGDKRKFISALIVPDREVLSAFAEAKNLTMTEMDEIIRSDELEKAIAEEIEERTSYLARYERIKKFKIISDDLTVENGFLTPKMELKRKKVFEHYKHLIEEIYSE